MKRDLVFLQSLQESFAAWTGLTIMICNIKGELQTNITWESRHTQEQFEKYVTKESLMKVLNEFHKIPHTMLLDTKFGVKIIISPIKTNGHRTNHFIISGVIVQHQSDEMITDYFESEQSLAIIEAAQELSDSEIRKKLDQITRMTEMISTYITLLEENEIVKIFSSLLSENLKQITNGTSSYPSILELGTFFEEVDFMGVALPANNHRYVVDTMIGFGADLFTGYEFRIGEGIMGYSIAAQKILFFEDITSDPRKSLFDNKQMKVVSLFCYPLLFKNEVLGLLFGGSNECQIRKTSYLWESLSSCATVLSDHILKGKAQMENRDLKIESEMLSDILAVYPTARSLKKTLYLIIDVGMNTMNFEFISIVYKNLAKADRIEMLSRGLSEEEIKDYGRGITKQLTKSDNQDNHLDDSNRAQLATTPWGTAVAEVPITITGKTLGTLSVGLKKAEDIDRFTNALSGLATAIEISIFFMKEEKVNYSKEKIVEWIQLVLQNFKPDKYQVAKKIINNASIYLRENGMKDSSLIEIIAYLAVCNRNNLNSFIKEKNLVRLMDEYYKVQDGKSAGDRLLETMAVICTYYENGESIDDIFHLKIVHEEIKADFESFIKRQQTSEKTIPIQEFKQSTSKSLDLGLTKREEEVLKEMMKGLGNKEIGATLFISEHTVKNHMTSILGKLEVADRSQAIAKMYQMGYKD